MQLRHVIVEGPDGSGKDTLIATLASELRLAVHPRASESATGPVPNLKGWVDDDMTTIGVAPPCVYNRHPAISEPIYAPLARGTKPQHPFEVRSYVMQVKRQLAEHCVMVWCMPPLAIVVENVARPDRVDMPGVVDGIYPIYREYQSAANTWPGASAHYDYTSMNPDHLVSRLQFTIRKAFV